MTKEQRKRARGQVSATVVLLQNQQPLGSFKVLNLSAGGALLVGRAPQAAAGPVDVLVRLSTGRTVRAGATVVREESVGETAVFAIAFSTVASDDHEAIDSLVLTSLADAREATALLVVDAPKTRQLLQRQLSGLGHPSFGVTTRQDARRFLEEPNVVVVVLVDLAVGAAEAQEVLAYVAEKHPRIRRVLLAAEATSAPSAPPLAQATVARPWTRQSLARALGG